MTTEHARLRVEPWVFFPSAAVIVVFVAFGALAPQTAGEWFAGAKNFAVDSFGWLFSISTAVFLLFSVALALSPYRHLRLGKDDDRPEFSSLTWFAMLFSAGMGIGLLFFSVAEPMMHYRAPPTGTAETASAARLALGQTFFHWGLHAWAVYVVMGLALAYFAYRHDLPLSIRSVFRPLLGDRIFGMPGHLIDLLAVFGTVFGLATSLGLGAKQINAGLSRLFGLANDESSQIVIICCVTVAATLSLVSGVKRGIRRLSELNLLLAVALLSFVFVLGPSAHVLRKLPADLWAYAGRIGSSLVGSDAMGDEKWRSSWTIFYWAWWIAWAPFVGTFVARISKGRTLGEFVLGVLLVPTGLTVIWMAVFGETAMFEERVAGAPIAEAVAKDTSVAIYSMLDQLPLSHISSLVAVITVTVFFVTSSDSGSFVVDMLTSGGHPNPPIWQRIFWAFAEGAVAIVLLTAGGLKALQSAAIATGLPFCVAMLLMCVSLALALKRDLRATKADSTHPQRSPQTRRER